MYDRPYVSERAPAGSGLLGAPAPIASLPASASSASTRFLVRDRATGKLLEVEPLGDPRWAGAGALGSDTSALHSEAETLASLGYSGIRSHW